MSVGVIILAAGRGTRMETGLAKVLHTAAGRTLLDWVLEAVGMLDPDETSVVVGVQADEVTSGLAEGIITAVQEPQNGTGHAAMVGLGGFTRVHDIVVVVPGDMPLIKAETLRGLVERHNQSAAAATVLTVKLDDPHGYGRIIRLDGDVAAIVEERDASHEQRSISEVNTSVYVFDGALLAEALEQISNENDQGEYYLTDAVSVIVAAGHRVAGFLTDAEEGVGVNTQAQLAEVAAVLRTRINTTLMESGVWMLDPSRVYIDAGVDVAPRSQIYPDTYLTGDTTVAVGACIGPSVQVHDSVIGADAIVVHAVLRGAVVGENSLIGPYTYLRPGTVLAGGTKIGAYVEVKNSEIGEGSKIPHLSYIGDATIGRDTNIGAATVTVNYDGHKKYRTTIGDRVRIGSDTMLVAPVMIGDDAYTGAGSVITDDVPEGSLGIERSSQRNISGYAERRRLRAEKESEE